MSKPISNTAERTQINLRVPDHLLERFDREHSNRSQAIRALMRAAVSEPEDTHRPEREDLEKAYLALWRASDSQGRIGTDTAKAAVAEACGIPKKAAREARIEPLEPEYVTPRWGNLYIRPPAS